MGDKLIEVVGLMNTLHMARVKGGIHSGERLAQCSTVTIQYVWIYFSILLTPGSNKYICALELIAGILSLLKSAATCCRPTFYNFNGLTRKPL